MNHILNFIVNHILIYPLPQYLELTNDNIPRFINNHIVSSMKNTFILLFYLKVNTFLIVELIIL